MKRAMIRALWGIYSEDKSPLIKRRYKMDKDIELLKKKGKPHDYISYTYGKENHEYLLSRGIKSILINDDPAPHNLLTEQYLHKIESIKYAMDVDGYDEILHLDWDCLPVENIKVNMWDILNKKESLQGCLQLYRRRKCHWREDDKRKVVNGGCLYIRDKNLPGEIIKCWEKLKGPSIEPPIALLLDNKYGGWIGLDKYWDLHEIEICNLARCSAFADRIKEKQNLIFKHYIKG